MKKVKFHAGGIIRYALVLCGVSFLWWYFRTYELFLIIVLLLALAAASLYFLVQNAGTFSVQTTLPAGGIGKERSVPVGIRVKSTKRFLGFAADVSYVIRNVFTEYESVGKERIWAAPGINTVLERELVSHHVGRVEVAVTELVVWDWLGICSIQGAAPTKAWTIAWPKAERADGEELAASVEDFPNENETKKRGTEINPDYEIREYVPGDDLKNIHWKLTAKTGRTMVRERLATGREKINVLLALTEDETENDLLIASLYSLGRMLLDRGYPIRLCWLGLGGSLQGQYVAEEGELENAMDEILSVSGKKSAGKAQNAMETEFPGEAYVIVKNGAYKGAYVRK